MRRSNEQCIVRRSKEVEELGEAVWWKWRDSVGLTWPAWALLSSLNSTFNGKVRELMSHMSCQHCGDIKRERAVRVRTRKDLNADVGKEESKIIHSNV